MATRRIRTTGAKSAAAKPQQRAATQKKKLAELADEAIALMDEIAVAQAKLVSLEEKALEISGGKEGMVVTAPSQATVAIVRPRSNAVNYVDPVLFWEAFPENDRIGFFASVKVMITEAKKHLPTKVIDGIKETTPGAIKPLKAKFTKTPPKAKK